MGTKARQRSNQQTERKQSTRRDPQDLPLTAYISAAMRRAKYKKLSLFRRICGSNLTVYLEFSFLVFLLPS